jgi:hypothetical protein
LEPSGRTLVAVLLAVARREPVLAAFLALYLAGFIVYGIVVGSAATPIYVLEIVGGAAIVAAVHRRAPLGAGLLWALALWGLLHLAGGMVEVDDGVLYNTRPVPFLPPFDKLVHAFGFGAATLVVGRVLSLRFRPPSAAAVTAVAAFGGLGVGALVEVFEFIMTRLYDETNVGGYTNTGWDLVANLVGAIAAAVWLGLRGRATGPLGPS